MPARLRPAPEDDVRRALAAVSAGTAVQADWRLLSKHFLALLAARSPGSSVEVRVPPYAAAQAVPGVRHTRGTPPAVVEMDAPTWVALATGTLTWAQAEAGGVVRASGERADLTGHLPLR